MQSKGSKEGWAYQPQAWVTSTCRDYMTAKLLQAVNRAHQHPMHVQRLIQTRWNPWNLLWANVSQQLPFQHRSSKLAWLTLPTGLLLDIH